MNVSGLPPATQDPAKAAELLSDIFGNAEIRRAMELSNSYMTLAGRTIKMHLIIHDLLYSDAEKVKEIKEWLRHWYIISRKHFSTTGQPNLTQENRVLKRYRKRMPIDRIAEEMKLPTEHIVKILTEPLWNMNNTKEIDLLDILQNVRLQKEQVSGFECFLRYDTMLPLDWIMQISGHDITEIMVITTLYRLALEAPLGQDRCLEYLDRTQMSAMEWKRCCEINTATALEEVSRMTDVSLDDMDWTAKYLAEEAPFLEDVAKRTAATLAAFDTLCEKLNEVQSTSPYKPRIGRIQSTSSQQEAKLRESLGKLRRSEDVYDNDPEVQVLQTKVNDNPIISKEEMEQLTVPTVESGLLFRANDDPLTPFVPGELVFRGDKEYRVKSTRGQVMTLTSGSCIAVDREAEGVLRVGMRVAARYCAARIYNPKPRAGWYSGTIITRMAPRYVVVFDAGFAADLFHNQVRLLTEQPSLELCPSHSANKARRTTQHGKCQYHHKMVCDGTHFLNTRMTHEFLKKDNDVRFFIGAYMESFPHWELVKMKNATKILRVNCDNRQGKGASAYMLHAELHTCLLRFPKDANDKCTRMQCHEHDHADEWLYRGSPRLIHIPEERKLFEQFKRKDLGLEPLQEATVLSPRRRLRAARTAVVEEAVERQADPRPLQMARKTGRTTIVEKTKKRGKPSRDDLRAINEAKQRTFENDVRMTDVEAMVWSDRYSQFSSHATCSATCLRDLRPTDPADVKYHEMSPFLIPLLNGWTRTRICLGPKRSRREKYRKVSVLYRAPCGKCLKDLDAISEFLRASGCSLTIDLFTFDKQLDVRKYARVNPEFLKAEDFCQHQENIQIPVVNSTHPDEPIPKHIYSRQSVPGKLKETDPARAHMPTQTSAFCSGCSCEDDCSDADRCECQRLTRENVERLSETLQPEQVGYYHRLGGDWNVSGVYECNQNCRCHRSRETKRKCYNTVVQQDIKFPLMLFRTPECGWGVRTRVDIPQGAFVANYAGEIFTDEQADILKRDAYYADLNMIANLEEQKLVQGIDNIEEAPAPKRGRGRGDPKEHHVRFNLEEYFGEGEDLFIVDAFVRGNIGKFFNHSCKPNMWVQHIIVDTHDVRLPWIAFFATRLIKAGEELTWNYGYEVGKVANRFLFCKCGERECKGRIL
uniref:SET domain-containing protein n=1 Tax=Steinernema glaseri TaxID=37863 RepID=A0A1I7ZKT8_9BILA